MMRSIFKQILFAAVTFAIYTLLINWKIAALLCFGIGWHEYCHILAAKYLGMKTKGFYLVPFMGGVAFVADKYKTWFKRVFVVIMGPVGGSVPGFILGGIYYFTGEPWLAAAAEWLILVNLFNLLPLSFLDGGQITESIMYSINETLGFFALAIGTMLAALLIFKLNIVLFMIILMAGGTQVVTAYNNWKWKRAGQEWKVTEGYMDPSILLSKKQIFISAGVYLLVTLVLGSMFLWLQNIPGASISYFLTHK